MRFLRFSLFSALAFTLAAPVRAETPADIPNPLQTRHSWVADNANVLSDADEKRINAILSPLERRNGAEVAVVTVQNLGGQTVEEFANELFRLWKIGKKDRDNGVVILAAIDDHKLRIDVDYGLQDILTDGYTGEILHEKVTPQFKKGAYGEGLYAGALAVAQKIDPSTVAPAAPPTSSAGSTDSETLPDAVFTPGAAVPPPVNQPPANLPPNFPSGSSGGNTGSSGGISDIFLILLGLFILFSPFLFVLGLIFLVIRWFRRPRRCPKCKTVMNQLSDAEEARSLSDVQMFEQKIGARDYRVWQCPNCQTEEISVHDLPGTQYQSCPKCRNITARSTSRMIKSATEWAQGLEEITVKCEWPKCGRKGSYRRSTPRLPSTRSSDYIGGTVIGSTWGSSMGSSGSSDRGSSSSSSSSYDSGSSSSSSFDSGPSDFGGSDSGGGGGGASDSW